MPDPLEEPQEELQKEPPPDPPEPATPDVRRDLFIPELERLLNDPAGFSLKNNFASFKVRVQQAVETIENRSGQLAEKLQLKVQSLRLTTTICAILGICAVLLALALPEWRVPALAVAGAELAALVLMRRRCLRLAADAAVLLQLSERYRPALDACAGEAELRVLAARIRAEMQTISDPPAGLPLDPTTPPP